MRERDWRGERLEGRERGRERDVRERDGRGERGKGRERGGEREG